MVFPTNKLIISTEINIIDNAIAALSYYCAEMNYDELEFNA